MSVSERWYRHLNEIGVGISFIFLISYSLSYFVFPQNAEFVELSVKLVPAIIAATTMAYVFIGYRLETKKSPTLAGLGTMLLLTAMVGIQVALTGGLESLYLPLWIVVVLLIGMFGWIPIVLFAVITNVYVALSGGASASDLASTLLYYATLQVPFAASWLLWHGSNTLTVGSSKDSKNNAINQKNNDMQKVISSIADAVITVNHERKITLFNPAAVSMVGWDAGEAMGLQYQLVIKLTDADTEEDLSEVDNPIDKVFSTGAPLNVEHGLTLVSKEGRKIPISLAASPLKDKGSGVVNSVVIILKDAGNHANAERQRAEFISTASHEMRTPVAAIEGYLALALNENVAKIDPKAREYLNKAHDSTQNLGKLLKDLLTTAKSEDGRLINNPTVINIGDFLKQVGDDLKFTADEKKLALNFAFSNDGETKQNVTGGRKIAPLYFVHVDPDRLREVITNLFDNAIKYTPAGSITIDMHTKDNQVVISVSDTGIGIPSQDAAHLFEKFYRVDNSATRRIGGTGLGLFICRQIVEMSNGRIWVESELGKGSTFFVSLPKISSEKAELLKEAERSIDANIVINPKEQ